MIVVVGGEAVIGGVAVGILGFEPGRNGSIFVPAAQILRNTFILFLSRKCVLFITLEASNGFFVAGLMQMSVCTDRMTDP